jgi:hypothetical protein
MAKNAWALHAFVFLFAFAVIWGTKGKKPFLHSPLPGSLPRLA